MNLNRGARSFPNAKNFARPAQPLPARQWLSSFCRYSRHLPPAGGSLSYPGSWREAPERLYHMPRFRSVSWLPEGNPSYNLSVTFGDSSPKGGAFGRPGRPCCSLGSNWAQSSGPCPNGQQQRNNALTKGAWQTAVNLNRGARSFPDAKNFARPVRSLPVRQWPSSLCRYSRHLPPAGGSLSYQGSWRAVGETERLYEEKSAL